VNSAPLCSRCKKPNTSNAQTCEACGQPVSLQLKFGDYEATEIIGKGGMGLVYKAFQCRLKRAVCIKTLLPEFASDQETSSRFAKEATTTAALNHPNIVSIFDVGTTPEGVAYLVMELIEGKSLRLVLRDEAPVGVSRALLLMDQILAALAEAHTHGIVHRDLKPANVLVVGQRDGTELCKLLDFGIARVLSDTTDERLTRTGMTVGTPGYMAPEQITGGEIDHRADLYAAGALLYELLCGQRVVTGSNDLERFKKVLLEDPPPPSKRTRSPVPAALDKVCLKALSRRADDRYSSANEFREALVQAMRAQPDAGGFHAGQIERTPIATAMASGTSNEAHSRALVAAVLAADGEWERYRHLEPLERSMREAITTSDFRVLRATLTTLQEELKLKGPNENLKLLVDLTREVLEDELPTLVDWLSDPALRAGGKWLLQLLGRRPMAAYLELLPGLVSEVRGYLLEVIRAIDPDASALAAQVKTLGPNALMPVLVSARSWPAEQSLAVFNAALQSTDAAVRQTALESLDEASAFRFAAMVRQRLHDPSQPVRTEALRWVGRVEDEAAVPDLSRLAQRSSLTPDERRAVWRTLGAIKSPKALELLALTLNSAKESEDVTELGRLLVRSRAPQWVAFVHSQLSGSRANLKRKAALELALREGSFAV
jgi:serine/threonine protein kinase